MVTKKAATKPKKTTSEYINVKNSSIHMNGVFAKKPIPKGTYIIEYVGQKISKKEGEKRADRQFDDSNGHKTSGGVYIFDLNKRYDLDGNVSWNTARFINHSCEPNCESIQERGKIWIVAIKKIQAGEELSYDYGYDIDDYKNHPCKCGTKTCAGFIVAKKHRKKLQKLTS